MIISTHTFTAQNNQPLYENRYYHDLPSDTRLVVDILKQWAHDNGVVKTINYNEDTLSCDVVNMWTEEGFQSFLSYANSIVGDYETWLSNFATIQSSIGFQFTRKIETS
jgi:hypothetical protein